MAQAGYTCVVRKSGATAIIAAEPMQVIPAGTSYGPFPLPSPNSTVFRITTAARRCIDSSTVFNLKTGTGTVLYSDIIAADFVNGEFTLSGATAGNATSLTFNGNFLPITTSSDFVPETKSFSLTNNVDLLETTVMASTVTGQFFHMRTYGLKDTMLTVNVIADGIKLGDLYTAMFNGAPLVIEIYFGNDAIPRFRGQCLVESISPKAQVDGLVETDISFKISASNSVSAPLLSTGFSYKGQP